MMGGSLLLTENVQKDVTQEVTPRAVLRCCKPRKFRWDATLKSGVSSGKRLNTLRARR